MNAHQPPCIPGLAHPIDLLNNLPGPDNALWEWARSAVIADPVKAAAHLAAWRDEVTGAGADPSWWSLFPPANQGKVRLLTRGVASSILAAVRESDRRDNLCCAARAFRQALGLTAEPSWVPDVDLASGLAGAPAEPGWQMVLSVVSDLAGRGLVPGATQVDPVRELRTPLLLVTANAEAEYQLVIEELGPSADGPGVLFPDPRALGATTLGDDFVASLRAAWSAAIGHPCWRPMVVRWRIVGLSALNQTVCGGSAGGAFAAALLLLAAGLTPRCDKAVTAAVGPDGRLGPVADETLDDKLRRAYRRNIPMVAVCPDHVAGRPDLADLTGERAAAVGVISADSAAAFLRWPHWVTRFLEAIDPLVPTVLPYGYVGARLAPFGGTGPARDVEYVLDRLGRGAARPGERAPFLLVLGDYGTGKSALCVRLGQELARRAREGLGEPGNPPRVPFYLPLNCTEVRVEEGGVVVARDLLDAVRLRLTVYGLNPDRDVPLADLHRLRDAGQLVLLLDGLDEFGQRIDVDVVRRLVDRIRDLAPSVPVLLTCRRSFYRSEREVRAIGATEILQLDRFEPDQVDRFLANVGAAWACDTYAADARRVLDTHPQLAEIARVPVHLRLLACRLARNGRAEWPDGVAGLYREFIDEAFERNNTPVEAWELGDREDFIRELAFDLHRWDRNELTFAEIREAVQRHAPPPPGYENGERARMVEQRARYVANCSFLVRRGQADRYQFIHQSFREFLVADALVSELFADRADAPRWNVPVYSEVFDFITDLLRARGLGAAIDRARATVFCSGTAVAHGTFIASLYRGRLRGRCDPAEDAAAAVFLRGLLAAPEGGSPPVNDALHAGTRHMTCQGLGAYPATEEMLACVRAAFDRERDTPDYRENSIVRAMLQRLIDHFAECLRRSHEVLELVNAPVGLRPEDARLILQITPERPNGALRPFRRGLDQDDQFWISVLGSMYLLGTGGDTDSYVVMSERAAASRNRHVRRAFNDTTPMTGLTPVPDRPVD